MNCIRIPRTRTTTDVKPDVLASRTYTTYVKKDGKWVYSTVLTHDAWIPSDTFSKSISDYTCKAVESDGSDPTCGKSVCRKVCADCVAASKKSFNSVSSRTFKTSIVSMMPYTGIVYPPEGMKKVLSGMLTTNPDQFTLQAITSYMQPPTVGPTAKELSNALRSITPSVEKFFPTVQIYETLFELKELKKLLDLFKVNKNRAPVDTFSGHYLGFNFGYLPLVSVIQDIITILITLDNVIDRWNDFATADRIMDFHGNLRIYEDTDQWNTIKYAVDDRYFFSTERFFKASIKDTYKVHLYIKPRIIPGDMRFRVLLKALGIDKPLAGFWELVPFSWLVDYFVNVDDMIDRWETGLASMFKFDVANLGYSTHRKIDAEYMKKYTLHGNPTKSSSWSSMSEETFTRVPLPTTALRDAIIPTEWGWESGPSGQQSTFILAVANNLRGKKMT